MLVLCMLSVGDLLSLRGNAGQESQNARKVISESLAVQLSTLISVAEDAALQHALSEFVARSEDVLAASLSRRDAGVIASRGDPALVAPLHERRSTSSHIVVPLYAGEREWGEVRIAFKALNTLTDDAVFFAFMFVGSLLIFFIFLQRVLMQLDPSRAVPGRVDHAFNLFSEGVVILDSELRILLSNKSAGDMINDTPAAQIGKSLDSWPWVKDEHWRAPWLQAIESGVSVCDCHLHLDTAQAKRLVVVSCTLVGEEEGQRRGVMVTLNDMSALQKKNEQLEIAMNTLEETQSAVARKNIELEKLASTDSLSGLRNRRSFMEELETLHASAIEGSTPMVCVMLDIDHFKNINDTYGHGVGDDVICAVAECLSSTVREDDIVGRYGGEEFVVAMPQTTLKDGALLAERLRAGVVSLASQDVLPLTRLSASFGVCEFVPHTTFRSTDTLLMLADKALYAAKGAGRNRVVSYDQDTLSLLEASTASANDDSLQSAAIATDEPINSAIDARQSDSAVEDAAALPGKPQSISERADVVQDIMAKHHQQVETLRSHDQVTQLPKRDLFIQAIDNEMDRAQRAGAVMGIVSIEIKDLNLFTSSLGQKRSDVMIKQIVDHVQNGLRASDRVARICDNYSLSQLSDAQFGVLLTDLAGVDQLLPALMRIRRLLLDPVDVDGMAVHPGYSIGVAIYPECGDSASALLDNAVDARIQASQLPEKVAYHFASKDVAEQSRDYIALESDLYKAVRGGLLQVHFQPKFDLEKRRIMGVEALVRWPHPERGFVPPDIFILIAESNGLVREIFTQVLEQSLAQLAVWDALGIRGLTVAVNLSGTQLRDKRLTAKVLASLAQAGLSSDRLDLELTETAIIQAPERALQILHELNDAGVSVSMDDFGTGYTSLALLSELPLKSVKIDRQFVTKLTANERTYAVVKSVIHMAHALHLKVIAEGIETPEQLSALDELGCDELQGYLISRPMSADDLTPVLMGELDHVSSLASRRRAS